MDHVEAARQLLVRRHQTGAGSADQTLLEFAEHPRSGDWTLRSALVRLAQPEPVKVSAVLELMRRCEGALPAVADHLDAHDGALELDALSDDVVSILVAVLELDRLADDLAIWAHGGPANPPLSVVDATCSRVFQLLEEAGVPTETGRPGSPR